MSELKTKVTTASVTDFLNAIEDETKRNDSLKLVKLFEEITGEKPELWSSNIVGFGKFHYKSERSSQEGDWMLTGFSPRKQALTFYVQTSYEGMDKHLEKLGKYTKSVGCIYVKKLEDVDEKVLQEVIKNCYETLKKRYSA